MNWILHIDTSTIWCSVALSKDNQLIELKEESSNENGKYIHSEKLHIFIQEVLNNQKIKPSDLSAISVSIGPGSYTGLRIGVASAKGLAAGLNIPIIAIPTLQALSYAAQIKHPSDFYLPLIDARRMECFSAIYNTNLTEHKSLFNLVLTDMLDFTLKNFCFFGDGSHKGQSILEELGGIWIPEIYCSASNLIELAYQKFISKNFEDSILLEPLYGKEFIAGTPKKKL